VTALSCGAFILWTQFGHASATSNKAFSDVLSVVVALACTVWSLWGITRKDGARFHRRGFLSSVMLSVGIGGYAVGGLLWAYYDLATPQAPFPSWADAGYLTGTVGTIVAVLLLPSRPMPGVMRVRVLLDSLMVATALVTFSWYFALGPTVLNGEATLFAKVLGAAYPLADLSMLFCVLVLASHSQEADIRKIRNLVTVGVLGYVLSDTVYEYRTLHETYQAGGPVDVGWILANFMFAQAAVALRGLRSRDEAEGERTAEAVGGRPSGLGRAILPYAFVPAVVGLLVYVYRTRVGGGLESGVYVGSATLLGLIMVRQFFAIAENSRLYRFLQAAYKELEALATTDSMTGLPNHRVFQERLRLEIARSEETGAPTCLLLVDVDRFKQYNDQFGHPAGDEALKIVARVLRENLRESDLAARYGGEEFAAVLSATSVEEAASIAERVRAACEATDFPHRPVTLSIGVAMAAGREAGSLIEAADHALYAAKHAGRNQVALEGASIEKRSLTVEEGGRTEILSLEWSLETSRKIGIDRLASSSELLEGPSGPLVRALLAMLELRDQDVERRSDRVMRFCVRLAEEGVARHMVPISPSEMNDLHLGALLHDIGKVGVPDAILNKPGALDKAEWEIVRRHPVEGAELLADFPQLAGAVPVVRSHHERWDGTGYPDGLAGEAIPLGARLFALADTMDAMGSDRPYRAALPYSAVRDEIRRMAGTQFDPSLVEAFLSVPPAEWVSLGRKEDDLRLAA